MIQRVTYNIAGQATAVRVIGDPTSSNNGRFYIHSDHLGSTSVLTKQSDGYIHTDSLTRYTPFGAYRSGGPNPITDRAFTGQKENMSGLGLYYYQARFYAPGIGRFLSADTLVPDPQNPQSLNRYAYVLNSPLNFSDPTGHRPSDGCEYEGCTLPGFMDPNQTWQDVNGTYLPYDPAISEQFPGDLTWEEAAFGTAGLFGVSAFPVAAEYIIGNVAWPIVAEAGSTIASWLCLGDGDCTNEAQSVWRLNPFQRGVAIENSLGRSSQLVQNFPVIDRFQNGVATSIKSIDLGAKSYQNMSTMTRTVRGYVNTLANWQGVSSWGGVSIRNSDIVAREVQLAIPPGASQAQLNALLQLQQWSVSQGVTLNVVVVP